MRKGATGAFIFEVAGEDCGAKADALAAKMSQVLAEREGVRVNRPQKKADLRLRDVDETISEAEVATGVATVGGCSAVDVKVGQIRRFPNRMGTVWIQMPIAAANKVAAAGKIRLGWGLAKAELLDVRPLQCYRCLEKGHVQANCPGNTDRTGRCFRCGDAGHVARECVAPVHCPVCADYGRKANHRVGSKLCTPPKKRPSNGGASQKPIAKDKKASAKSSIPKKTPPIADDQLAAPSGRRKRRATAQGAAFRSSSKGSTSSLSTRRKATKQDVISPARGNMGSSSAKRKYKVASAPDPTVQPAKEAAPEKKTPEEPMEMTGNV